MASWEAGLGASVLLIDIERKRNTTAEVAQEPQSGLYVLKLDSHRPREGQDADEAQRLENACTWFPISPNSTCHRSSAGFGLEMVWRYFRLKIEESVIFAKKSGGQFGQFFRICLSRGK